MPDALWPLWDLRLTTPDLELRLPTMAQLEELAALAYDGVHDPAVMPFMTPWTDTSPLVRARSTLQWHWSRWGAWQPTDWSLDLVALSEGRVVGTQGLVAKDFPALREVSTGSWVGRGFQGRGIGRQMRTAVLVLAFDHLGATAARSGAFADNPASLAVSRRLGYAEDGIETLVRRGAPAELRRLRLERAGWLAGAGDRPAVTVEGFEACRELFGVQASQQGGT